MIDLALIAASLASAFAPPIVLRVQAPRTVASGEEVAVVATVCNLSKRPVTLIGARLPGIEWGMDCESRLEGPGGSVFPDSVHPMIGQFFRSQEVSSEAFFVLRPGEVRELYRETFRQVFADGPPSSLISERAKAGRTYLPPGRYRVRIVYRLDPHVPVESRSRTYGLFGDSFKPEPRIVPLKAKRLLDDCWRGEISAEAAFQVVPIV